MSRGSKETGKRVGTFLPQDGRKHEKVGRDKKIQVDMLFEKLEKGRGIVKEMILTV